MTIGFTSHTLPPNQMFISVTDFSLPLTFATHLGIMAAMLNFMLMNKLVQYFESGFYNTVLMKGSTRSTFLLGMYIVDISHGLMVLPIVYVALFAFGFVIPGFWLSALMWSFANPLFLYLMSYTFVYARGFKGSTIKFISLLVDIFTTIAAGQFSAAVTQ